MTAKIHAKNWTKKKKAWEKLRKTIIITQGMWNAEKNNYHSGILFLFTFWMRSQSPTGATALVFNN